MQQARNNVALMCVPVMLGMRVMSSMHRRSFIWPACNGTCLYVRLSTSPLAWYACAVYVITSACVRRPCSSQLRHCNAKNFRLLLKPLILLLNTHSAWSKHSTLRCRGLTHYCVFTIKTSLIVKWHSTLRFRGLTKYCVFPIKTSLIVKWKAFQLRD